MDSSLTPRLQQELAALAEANRLRRLRKVQVRDGQLYNADGRRLIDASSNDYLGLSQHPLVKQRAAEWALQHGAGAPASRLITGTRDITIALEEKLAAFKQCEAALLFSSGFQANATVIPALVRLDEQTILFSDALNHASMVHGCRASGAPIEIFRHNDLNHLEELLQRYSAHQGRKLILSESVFSMDGDRADVAQLSALATRHGAALYLDEAHATGVVGPQGRGLAAGVGDGQVDVVMGTLGKAIGAFGAYVAGSRALIDYLVNRCAGFIYTTALPPAVLGAVDAALDLLPGMDNERKRLDIYGNQLRAALNGAGFNTLGSTTQIVPAVIGAEAASLAAARQLEAAGILAVAIRPPTVPEGTSRLRLTLSSSLTTNDMAALLAAIDAIAVSPAPTFAGR